MPEFYVIFSRKIDKIPELYVIFAWKMPKFYIIIARNYNYIFPDFFFGGGRGHVPLCPRRLRLWAQAQDWLMEHLLSWTLSPATLVTTFLTCFGSCVSYILSITCMLYIFNNRITEITHLKNTLKQIKNCVGEGGGKVRRWTVVCRQKWYSRHYV